MDTLSFISDICGSLKTLKRTGWVRSGIPLPESDADHMHRCAMCAMLVAQASSEDYSLQPQYHPENVQHTKLLRMALTHDLCEAIAGDITPQCDNVDSKYDKEEAAMKEIQAIVGDPLGKELYELWKEYEEQNTLEAIYCKDIDKFEMVVQAYEYEKAHLQSNTGLVSAMDSEKLVLKEPLRGFFSSTNQVFRTPLFRRLDHELRERRTLVLLERGWEITNAEQQQ